MRKLRKVPARPRFVYWYLLCSMMQATNYLNVSNLINSMSSLLPAEHNLDYTLQIACMNVEVWPPDSLTFFSVNCIKTSLCYSTVVITLSLLHFDNFLNTNTVFHTLCYYFFWSYNRIISLLLLIFLFLLLSFFTY